MAKKNITLIGMPGAGKSTVGVLLAKTIGYDFIDTDIIIQNKYNKLLQVIVDEFGYSDFVELEENVIKDLDCIHSVISPGGSVVYGERAMLHLKDISEVVYLDLSLDNLKERLGNIATRGVLSKEGQSLELLYEERTPLYERFADKVVNCNGKNSEEVLQDIISFYVK